MKYFSGITDEMWFTFFQSCAGSAGWSAAMPFFGVYLNVTRGVPLSLVGVSYLFAALLGFGSQLVGGRLVDSFGPKPVMYFGYIVATITSTITAYLVTVNTSVLILLIIYPCFNFARGFSQPAIGTIVSGRKGSQLRTGFALQYIGGNLGFAIGPAVGGFLAQYAGLRQHLPAGLGNLSCHSGIGNVLVQKGKA